MQIPKTRHAANAFFATPPATQRKPREYIHEFPLVSAVLKLAPVRRSSAASLRQTVLFWGSKYHVTRLSNRPQTVCIKPEPQ